MYTDGCFRFDYGPYRPIVCLLLSRTGYIIAIHRITVLDGVGRIIANSPMLCYISK